MQWKTISPDEAKGLKYASTTGKESPYRAILDATEKGPVQVNVEQDSNLQSLKWALSRQMKKYQEATGAKIVMATLADKSGVVLSRETPQVPEASKPVSDAAKK